MATKQSTIDFLLEQLGDQGRVTARKMFGEYALYCDAKVVALVCDNQLFVKPTPEGAAFIGKPEEAAAYAGAKPSFLITGDRWDDADWLTSLIVLTAKALPPAKKKPAKRKVKC